MNGEDCVQLIQTDQDNNAWGWNDQSCTEKLIPLCNYVDPKYFIGYQTMNWGDARAFCIGFGSNLASVHSEYEFNQTKRICNESSSFGIGCWLGLNDYDNEGIWEWGDGTSTDYGFISNQINNSTIGDTPWAEPGEPNNYDGTEDCVIMEKDIDCYDNNMGVFKWNDQDCDMSLEYVPLCNYPTMIDDSYSLYETAINRDYKNQGKILGILSGGLWTVTTDSFYHSIGQFSWSSEGTGPNLVTLMSMIFSSISIIITIITICTQRKIYFTQNYMDISFNVTGQCVIDNYKTGKRRVKPIKKYQ